MMRSVTTVPNQHNPDICPPFSPPPPCIRRGGESGCNALQMAAASTSSLTYRGGEEADWVGAGAGVGVCGGAGGQ